MTIRITSIERLPSEQFVTDDEAVGAVRALLFIACVDLVLGHPGLAAMTLFFQIFGIVALIGIRTFFVRSKVYK
jgi:hypothetical protein